MMPIIRISNGTIEEIFGERDTVFVTVSYMESTDDRERNQTIRLVAGPRTVILNMNGIPVSAGMLRVGMVINAVASSAMTRSIPPQSAAYLIEIVREALPENVVIGAILNIDRNNRSFTTISERDFSTIIRFNVPEDAVILNRLGRPVDFERLVPGMRVWVRHANFMAASIPPQTTALEVGIL